MFENSVNSPESVLRNLFDLLIEENGTKRTVVFLTKFSFLLFLGTSAHYIDYNFIINQLQKSESKEELREFFEKLFKTLGTPKEQRDDNEFSELAYIGNPFDFKEELPVFSEKTYNYLMDSTIYWYRWNLYPAIEFCNLFESFIKEEEKHRDGIYFTSSENIHKVIDDLFLKKLSEELKHILKLKVGVKSRLEKFLTKISNLKFLDPSCGVGNFLVESFVTLKRFEEQVIFFIAQQQISIYTPSVTVDQFYGFEVNDYIGLVAKTGLFIAQFQMNLNPNDYSKFIPYENDQLKTANALRVDWKDLISNKEIDYIMGNPPFLGARLMSPEQKEDLKQTFGEDFEHLGDLDYVSGWFKRALDFIKGTNIEVAFVSTNSIAQGISASYLLGPLIKEGLRIDFVYQSFEWEKFNSNISVYVVIIGFNATKTPKEHLIVTSEGKRIKAKHLNGYLEDGPEIYISCRNHPIEDVPEIGIGNKPVDGGNFLFTKEEYLNFIKEEPGAKPFFRPFFGSRELINRIPRYCLYLGGEPVENFKDYPKILDVIEKVRFFRNRSRSEETRRIASKPTAFHVDNNPDGNYLAIPRVTTNTRAYLPIAYLGPENMSSDALLIIPNCGLYHFGVLTSSIHKIWKDYVGGRLGNNTRYSKELIYNNFPWPNPTEEEQKRIEETAQKILDVRAQYPDYDFNKLYSPESMPEELKVAHDENDKAVYKAYHFKEPDLSEKDLILKLLEKYKDLTTPEPIGEQKSWF